MVWGGREGGGGGRVVQPLSISKVLQLGIHVGKEKRQGLWNVQCIGGPVCIMTPSSPVQWLQEEKKRKFASLVQKVPDHSN